MPMQDFDKRLERRAAIRAKMDPIARKILVLSGKGGVGKTTVAVNIGNALADSGHRTGILDTDIHGPNVAKMTGVHLKRLQNAGDDIMPVPVRPNLAIAGIDSAMDRPESPVIWRGPMKSAAIEDLLARIAWGELDFLLIDSPPGTGDEQLTVCRNIPELTGAIIVTTPQEVAVLDSRRSIEFCRTMGVAVLGVVENMAGLVCPHCDTLIDVFGNGTGRDMAQHMGVPFLGSIPIEPSLRVDGDQGIDHVASQGGSASSRAFMAIATLLVEGMTSTVVKGREA